ncbi:MAG: hypothetical protein COV66_06875 [Nitrospinae bacterium CG11_big_fil_rev_8_21_14_0_20_45_15]|nr:MAG: hypothetical protein COV66_06875 [Nitrospinae bacterium CG11_big_fil_rev_8_21_14_0_20_45_15]
MPFPEINDSNMKKLTKDEFLGLIFKIGFFKTFTPEEKYRLADVDGHTVSFSPNEYILQEGDVGNALYILLRGKVYISKSNSPGVRLAELNPGAIFGEACFLASRTRITNVRADGNALALRIDPDYLKKVGPEIADKTKDQLIKVLIKKLERMNLMLQEAKKRIPDDDWHKVFL